MNAILNNVPARVVIAAALVYGSLMLHMALGPTNILGIGAIYITFVVFAWWAAEFKPTFLVKSIVYALPDLFIPPIILLPLRNILDSNPISWIIGTVMTIYTTFMVGWMLAAYAKSKVAPAESNV